MNIGKCPYDDCDGLLMFEVPERTPTYALVECDECKRNVWYKFSRLDPEAWTQAAFEAEHEFNYETMQIKRRAGVVR